MSYVRPLHIRVWECGARGAVLDRDINAAVHVAMAPGTAQDRPWATGGIRASAPAL
ncbi:hypothetical protein [Streptomyces atratus]|uniref:hypothetical protein n=1 Tax=Streptomyces atratus TaxID=1893 RepID=UPI0033D8A64C